MHEHPPASWRSVGLVVLAGLLLARPAAAQTPASYQACYVPSLGALYLIGLTGLPSACLASSHVLITWTDGSGALRTGTNAAGDLSGTYPNPSVARIQGTAVASTAPTSGQVLSYNGTTWTPATAAGSGPAGGDLGGTYPNPSVARIQGTAVASTAPTSGQVLSYDGTAWTPAAPSLTETDPTWVGAADSASDVSRLGHVSIGATQHVDYKLQVVSSSTEGGLRITNSSNVSGIRIDNVAGAYRPLVVNNAGLGGVLFGNSGNSSSAVNINNDGTGSALRIDNSGGGRGLYVVNSGGGLAGYFGGTSADVAIVGNLDVGGTLSKGGGSFTIDHPLDPENRILRHSFVESPDMMNVYNGIVTTDSLGVSIVELPAYFEALNRDFRYQLTVIGRFAQAIVIEEVRNNHFSIRTNEPRVRVSWQVTGIRRDRWAEAHRIVVEEMKPDSMRGRYVHR